MASRLRFRPDPYLLLLWALSLFALTPLLSPGYFYSAHDGRHTVFYQIMFDAALHDGALWPRWAMHHAQGYGYPTFLLQAPLGFYLGEIFVLLGAGFTNATKLTWATGFLLSGWGMYQLVLWWLPVGETRAMGEDKAIERPPQTADRVVALVAALLYVYLPYRLVDVYVRAALNDTLLLAWFPWVFLAFDRLLVGGLSVGWQRRFVVATAALGGALLTHTFALLSFVPLLITFICFRLLAILRRSGGWHTMLLVGSAGIGALLLAAAFLIPLLAEGSNLQSDVYVSGGYDFRNHFVFLGQFFSPFWGYGYSDDPTGANDGMSFQIGALIVILCLAGTLGIKKFAIRSTELGIVFYLAFMLAALLFVMMPIAQPLWELFSPLAVIQFPWRLLALTGFVACAFVGISLGQWVGIATQPSDNVTFLPLLLLVIWGSADFLNPPLQAIEAWREDGRSTIEFEQQHPDMMPYTIWSKVKFTTSPMTQDYLAEDYHEEHGKTTQLTRLTILKGAGEIISQASAGSSGGGVVRMSSSGVVRINLQNFPGWRVSLDGTLVAYRVSPPEGLLEIDVPTGEHHIEARMGSTTPRWIGALVSWGMIGILVCLLWWERKNKLALTV